MAPESLKARLSEVHELLERLLADGGGAARTPPSHWELPVLPPPDPEGRLSSTDLLSWWFQAPLNRSGNPDQDLVLEQNGGAHNGSAFRTERRRPEDDQPAPAFAGGGRPIPESWADLSTLFPGPEERLAEEHAQAAVDCLYEFLHAVGRRDVEAAMELIDDEYHAVENDVEVDKLKFGRQLEAHLEALRGRDFEISLAIAPEPVNHPCGVLIAASIQFDAEDCAHGAKSGSLERRIAVLRQDDRGIWRIQAFPRVMQ